MTQPRLRPKLALVRFYNDAKVLRLKDITGNYDAITNTGGYGTPNLTTDDVQAIVITVNKQNSKELESLRYNRVFDPLHPEYLIIPNAKEIAEGTEFEINSLKFQVTSAFADLIAFRNGTVDLNYYVCGDAVVVEGLRGNNFLEVGFDPTVMLETADSVIVGKDVYHLDKSKGTDLGTKVYLTTKLKEDVTSVLPSYRANLKVMNAFKSKCILWQSGKILSTGYNQRLLDREQGVLKVMHNLRASEIAWEMMDYTTVDRLLEENSQIGTKIMGIC